MKKNVVNIHSKDINSNIVVDSSKNSTWADNIGEMPAKVEIIEPCQASEFVTKSNGLNAKAFALIKKEIKAKRISPIFELKTYSVTLTQGFRVNFQFATAGENMAVVAYWTATRPSGEKLDYFTSWISLLNLNRLNHVCCYKRGAIDRHQELSARCVNLLKAYAGNEFEARLKKTDFDNLIGVDEVQEQEIRKAEAAAIQRRRAKEEIKKKEEEEYKRKLEDLARRMAQTK